MSQISIPEVQQIQTLLAQMPSKRARILKGLELLLKTVNKDNGYVVGLTNVSFNVKGWRDLPADQTPVAYIVDSNTILVRHAGCVREYIWDIEVFGCVKDKDIWDFENCIADVEQSIYDNNTLFGEVNKMEVENILTDNQLFSQVQDNGAQLFSMVVKMEFTRRARNAR